MKFNAIDNVEKLIWIYIVFAWIGFFSVLIAGIKGALYVWDHLRWIL